MQAHLLLAALISLAFANYDSRSIYSDAGCTTRIAFQSKDADGGCVDVRCTLILATGQYFTQTCDTPSVPTIGSTAIKVTGWSNQYCGNAYGNTPAADPSMWFAFLPNTCINYATEEPFIYHSFRAGCLTFTTYAAPNCDVNFAQTQDLTELTNRCFFLPEGLTAFATAAASTGFSPTCNVWEPIPNTCFHEDTEIVYNNQKFTLESLKTQEKPVCAIPHEVKTDGVKIKTSCGGKLRLTKDHLVYTQEGLKTAGSVKIGDFLFSDVEEKNVCEVTSIKIERHQNYFGLNCEDSVVLANGYKTSTFGITHDIPSLWMKYASKVFGVHGASAWGDAVASVLAKLNLL